MGIRLMYGTSIALQGFVPATIQSFGAGADVDITTYIAMRVNAASLYKIVRVFSTYVGDSTNGTDGTAAFSVSKKKSWETLEVWVAGVKKTITTHYTVGGSTVTFTAGNVPTTGQSIQMFGVSPEATMPAACVSIISEEARFFRFTGATVVELMEA